MSLTIAILAAGCATEVYQTYPGPKLPRNETARITAHDTTIVSIDGTALPAGRVFMLRAGVHAVSAGGTVGGLTTLCLVAAEGGNYQVRPGGIDRTVPEIYDVVKGSVAPTVLARVDENCAPSLRGNVVVAITAPAGARVHRGVPPPNPWDEKHEVVSGLPHAREVTWGLLVELPVRLLLGMLYVVASAAGH